MVIFSDYDADGIPGGVVLHDYFKKIGFKHFSNYIPHRHDEGFGLNKEAITAFKKNGVTLLITVDCGIADKEEVALAKSFGIDVIITDHHEPGEELPEAFAIVNPKTSGDYPEKMLCGAGVAFKLVEGLLKSDRLGIPLGWEKWLLDMVGIATLSDMVPLRGENRVFAKYGLLVLQKSPRVGLQRLLRTLKINQKTLTEDDVGFMIAPRINAASRMGVSEYAFELLTCEDEIKARELVALLEEVNTQRKVQTAHLTKEVKKAIEAKYAPDFRNKVIVVGDPTWKPSMLGLVAGSLVEKEGKPVFLWGREGLVESLKGSCRSVPGVSVTDLMAGVKQGILSGFGGHHGAGGFSISYDTVHLLQEEIERAFDVVESNAEVVETAIDIEVIPELISDRILGDVEKLAPFGVGNPKPLFLIKESYILGIEFFGKEKNHLKVKVKKPDGKVFEAISFFASEELVQKINIETKQNIVGHIERALFGGSRVRVRIVDIV
jgi:single-stranded-DNA-specific exonuclease